MIYQIYYQENQDRDIIFTPYFNQNCSVYFENSVIEKLIEYDSGPYFGVLPWSVEWKINRMLLMPAPFRDISAEMRSLDLIKKYVVGNEDIDFFFLMEHESHDPIQAATRIHPKFTLYWRQIIERCGYTWEPGVWDHVIYCNFFIAKTKLYRRYVDELLRPAMHVMDTMPELMEDAKYPKVMSANLKEQLQLNHYPYHPFICERLFSFWYNFIM